MLKKTFLATTIAFVMASNIGFAQEIVESQEVVVPVSEHVAVPCGEPCGDPCCDPCGDFCYDPCCCSSGNWAVYGDWLYWRTRRCDLDYAVHASSGASPFDRGVKHVCSGWDNGFRLGIARRCCNTDYGIRFTHFSDCESSKATEQSGGLARTRLGQSTASTSATAMQFARGHYDVDYRVLDLEAGYDLGYDYCSHGRVFGGFRYAEINQKFSILYANDSSDLTAATSAVDRVKEKVDLDAYGLYFGGRYGYDKDQCISLYGSFSYGLLIGDVDRKYFAEGNSGNSTWDTHVNLKDSCWKLLSNIDLAIGLNYHLCQTRCGRWDIGIGYEFHQWLNVPDFLNFVSGASAGEVHIDHNSDNLGFDGLYLRLAGQF